MSQIILDFGSGNTCRNDWPYAKRMIDELKAVDTGRHEIIIKWQLFRRAGKNIPLTHEIFRQAYDYAASLGYKTTSSVFDLESLSFLLQFKVPFIKIANRRDLDWLIGEVPRKIPVYVSVGEHNPGVWIIDPVYLSTIGAREKFLCCISNYPALLQDYEKMFPFGYLENCVSDHTTNFELWDKYHPKVIEWHYGPQNSTGLDAGPFMRTPEMLRRVL